jgi:hypothetical protein
MTLSEYIEAPTEGDPDAVLSIFLAGSITGAEDWQAEISEKLLQKMPKGLQVYNPRRADFDVTDPTASQKQIEWEHRHLRMADVILFWFSDATLGPITLYELGAWSMTDTPLAVACHPEYKRLEDVVIQTRLVRPEIVVGLDREWLLLDALRQLRRIPL